MTTQLSLVVTMSKSQHCVILQKAVGSLSQYHAEKNQTRHTVFPEHKPTNLKAHPLQAGDVHFIATSPFTA